MLLIIMIMIMMMTSLINSIVGIISSKMPQHSKLNKTWDKTKWNSITITKMGIHYIIKHLVIKINRLHSHSSHTGSVVMVLVVHLLC